MSNQSINQSINNLTRRIINNLTRRIIMKYYYIEYNIGENTAVRTTISIGETLSEAVMSLRDLYKYTYITIRSMENIVTAKTYLL